jgi:Phosphotransferase enzyme family
MNGFPLLASPYDLTPDHFNALFAHLGIDADVRSFTSKSIGTGQIGDNVRFVFDYARASADTPKSLVGKFPSASATSLAAAKLLGHYQREVMVYRHFPKVAGVITPAALYTDYDPETNRFALIMQDMAPSAQGDQLQGCTPEAAEVALAAAAVLHAAHWQDPALDQHAWLQGTSAAPPPAIGPDHIAALWFGFKDRYGAHLAADDVAVGDAFAAAIPRWSTAWAGPVTLIHNDFRLDNMLFAPPGAARPVAVVDWQTAGKGAAANDVAYFIGAGLTREARPKHEARLIAFYHRELVRHGVTGYSLADLTHDYRWFCFYGMSVAFGAAMLVQQTARGDEMFLTMLRRHAAQARDNSALDLLP